MARPRAPWIHPCCQRRDRPLARRFPHAPPGTRCLRRGRLRDEPRRATTAAPSSTGTSGAARATT
eukprot:2890816-Alexandrium_andersonii.AAC.1